VIVTTGAHALMVPTHGRMPAIIRSDHWQDWLAAPMEGIKGLVDTCSDEDLPAWPDRRRVRKTAGDSG